MLCADLLERLKIRALDPKSATDQHLDEGWDPPFSHVASPPVSPERFAELERELGCALPEVFQQVYTQVGDGNFGPGYGLLPLKDHRYTSTSENVVVLHEQMTEQDWPEHLLLFCYWGCDIYSVLNVNTGQVGILDLDACEEGTPPEEVVLWQTESLQEWLENWLEGKDLFFDLDEP